MPLKPLGEAIICIVGPCIDDTDFKSQETEINYNAAGMSLDWIQEEPDGTFTKTDLTLTTGGGNDWTHVGNGYYAVEITLAQNNLLGMGWVAGKCDGVLPFESPHYDIVPVAVYNALVRGTAYLPVDTIQVESADASETISGLIPAASGIAAAVWNEAVGSHTLTNTFGKFLGGAPAGASLAADIASIIAALGMIAPTTDTADSVEVVTGTVAAGALLNTYSDDDNRYELAPANPGGLNVKFTFAIGLNRAPASIGINGYWNGSSQYANVFAYNYITGLFDQLTNSTTRMNHRTSDANYSFSLNREHIDPATGDVLIQFVSASTNTGHRLKLDRILVSTVDSSSGADPSITAQDVWNYAARTLTDVGGEVNPAPTIDEIKAAMVAALITDLYGEPSSVPGVSSSLKDKLTWLFALARNKIRQTESLQSLRNDGDTANIATAAVSDDGTTFVRDEWS